METEEKFKQLFALPQNGFNEPIDLLDTKVGFSVYKDRENPEYKSLFRAYIDNAEFDNPNPIKRVVIKAMFGKYTNDGITVSSNEFDRKHRWPLDITNQDDYFYNLETNQLLLRDKPISGIDALEQIDALHIKTTKPIKGFWLRLKLWVVTIFIPSQIKLQFSLIAFLNYLVSGNQVSIYDKITYTEDYRNPIKPNNLNIKRSEPIDIYGYKVEPWIAGLYCTLHLIAYAVLQWKNISPEFIKNIFEYNFLTIIYVIFSLGLFNTLIPKLLRANHSLDIILLFLQQLYFEYAFKSIKVK